MNSLLLNNNDAHRFFHISMRHCTHTLSQMNLRGFMTYKSTDELLKILKSTPSTSKLKHYVDSLSSDNAPLTFVEFLRQELTLQQISVSKLILLSQIQRNYAYQILDGKRNPSRDKVLSLCFALNLGLTKTQHALTLSNNSQLYSRHKRDSILIFALEKKLSVQAVNELLYEMGENTLS